MNAISDIALTYVGKVKYVFGSDNIDGGTGDCSSYTQTVFRKAGYNIGRTANEQYMYGTPVAKSDLQKGDLVFFQNTYNTPGASHVGIYVGNGKMVQNGSNGVTVENLSDTYWTQHYLGARRVSAGTDGELSTVSTVSASNGGEKSLDFAGQVVRFIVILGLFVLAFVFMLTAFDANPANIKTKIAEKVTKNKKGGTK